MILRRSRSSVASSSASRQNSTGSSSNISPLCSATTKIEMMNARRCILLLAIASSLVLAGCAIHQPPFGADIMPESARAKIPGSWAGPHRSGEVVPNWIRNFGDPELTALVADAVERNPDLKAAAARVEASRAAVRIAASSLYPRIAMKGLGERQGQRLSGDLGRNINPPSFGGPGTEDSGGCVRYNTPDNVHQPCGGVVGAPSASVGAVCGLRPPRKNA